MYWFHFTNNGVKLAFQLQERNCKVAEYKEEINKIINIPAKFIVLKSKNLTLDNDKYFSEYALTVDCEIEIKVEVVVIVYDMGGGSKEERFMMDVNDSIRDLRSLCCSRMEVSDVKIVCDELCQNQQCLKEYLHRVDGVFTVYKIITLEIISTCGQSCFIEAGEDDTVDSLLKIMKEKLYKDFNNLMVKNYILEGKDLLYKFNGEKIFHGFIINVQRKDQVLFRGFANFDTKIIWLMEDLCNRFKLNIDSMVLSYDQCELSKEETLGFYKISENALLSVDENIKVIIYRYNSDDIDSYIFKESKTVMEVKEELSIKYGLDANEIALEVDEKELEDTSSIGSCGLDDCIITIKMKNNLCMNNGRNKDEKISLSIITSCTEGPYVNINVEHNCSIDSLKRIISQEIRDPFLCKFDIYAGDKIIKEGSIDLYDVKDKDTLILKLKKFNSNMENHIIINVKHILNDKSQQYFISDFYNIKSLKCALRDQHNVNLNRIHLFYRDSELNNDDIISELDVEIESTFSLEIDEDNDVETKKINLRVKNFFKNKEDSDFQSISVNNTETIESLIKKVDDVFNLSKEKYVLTFDKEILKKENMLITYDVKDDDEVIICRSLLVNYFIGNEGSFTKVYRYAFISGDKVEDLHQKIFKKMNIKPTFINLSFNGCYLESDMDLEETGIENESTLFMLTTLAGGFDDQHHLYTLTY